VILIDNMLLPWLPPYVSCGTGVIIDAGAAVRSHNHDDVIVYDTSLVPSVMASSGHAPEGVFLFNSVLLRIEVKSTLRKSGVASFIDASVDVAELKFQISREHKYSPLMGALNMLFAFHSDLEEELDTQPDKDLHRLIDVMEERDVPTSSGKVSAICIPGRGFWKIARRPDGEIHWQKLRSADPLDHVAWWVAVMSSSCYEQHAMRQGRDPKLGVEAGIGRFLPGGDAVWSWV